MARLKICGVYAIVSSVNNRRYIGSSSEIMKRWDGHRSDLRKNKHRNSHLQRAWNKYGEDAFEFVVLEECAVEQLLEREQSHMDGTTSAYNCGTLVATPRRGMAHTEEAKAKISAANKGNKSRTGQTNSLEARKKQSLAAKGHTRNVGRKHSQETKDKISAAQMGHTVSEETRSKISEAKKGRKQTPAARANMSAAQKGRKHSLETKTKMSEAAKARWAHKKVDNNE